MEFIIILFLLVLNGVFAMYEIALVSLLSLQLKNRIIHIHYEEQPNTLSPNYMGDTFC